MTSAKEKRKIAQKVKNVILRINADRDRITSSRKRDACPVLLNLIVEYVDKHGSDVPTNRNIIRREALAGPFRVSTLSSQRCVRVTCVRTNQGRRWLFYASVFQTEPADVDTWDRNQKWEGDLFDAIAATGFRPSSVQ